MSSMAESASKQLLSALTEGHEKDTSKAASKKSSSKVPAKGAGASGNQSGGRNNRSVVSGGQTVTSSSLKCESRLFGQVSQLHKNKLANGIASNFSNKKSKIRYILVIKHSHNDNRQRSPKAIPEHSTERQQYNRRGHRGRDSHDLGQQQED